MPADPQPVRRVTLRECDALVAEHVMGWTHIGPVYTFADEGGPSIDVSAYTMPSMRATAEPNDIGGVSPVLKGKNAREIAEDRGGGDRLPVNGASLWAIDVVPLYSTTWDAAGLVTEWMNRTGWSLVLRTSPLADSARFYCRSDLGIAGFATAATAPLAISLAALRAKGIPVEIVD